MEKKDRYYYRSTLDLTLKWTNWTVREASVLTNFVWLLTQIITWATKIRDQIGCALSLSAISTHRDL